MNDDNLNNFQYSKGTEPNNKKELLMLGIEIGENEKKYLKIYSDSKPEQLAYEFCLQNNLDFDSLQELTTQIRNAFISNGLPTSSTMTNNVVSTANNNITTLPKENTISQYEERPQIEEVNNNDIDKIQKENEVLTNHTVNSMSKSSSKKRPSYLQPTKSSQSKLKMNQSNNESNIANKSMNSTSNNYYSKSNNSSTSNIKRNYRPYTTNQVTLNYGERLYHKEQKLQEKKQQKISQQRN